MFALPEVRPEISKTKGYDLMIKLLLNQYQESENLKEYISAFTSEMDLLFEETEKVFYSRFLDLAEGEQLDVIGIILGESRGLGLPITFFGFSDDGINTANAGSLADEADPSNGGVFRSEGQSNTNDVQLSDISFRNLLKAKAFLLVKRDLSINTCYYAISYLLGKVPQKMELTVPTPRVVTLELSNTDTSIADVGLIQYFSKYLAPLGTNFNIVRT